MVDVDDVARDAARGVNDSATRVRVPDIDEVRSSRTRRRALSAAAGGFAVTLVVVGVAVLRGGAEPDGPDVAGSPTTAPDSTHVTAQPVLVGQTVDGVGLEWTEGWAPASENLTPAYSDPLELLSVATFPLSADRGVCDPFPWQAVVDFPADGGFVTVRERFRNIDAGDFSPRPAAFGAEAAPYVLPEGDCLDNTARGDIGTMRWFQFEDGGRFLQMLVVIGSQASEDVVSETWEIANSLTVLPGNGVATLTSETIYAGNAFVLDPGTGPMVCGVVAESLPPQCGGPRLHGLDWADVPWAEAAQGVTWADVYIEFRVADGEFHLTDNPSQWRSVLIPGPVFPEPPAALDLGAILDELTSLRPADWPAGIVGVSTYSINESGGYVEIGALVVTEEGQSWLDDRYGAGAVRATGSLVPKAEVEVEDAPARNVGAPPLPGEPDVVRAREPLFYCGAIFDAIADAVVGGGDLEHSDLAADCFRERLDQGLQAEIIVVRATIEGDPIIWIYRGQIDGKFEVFVDSTRDAFGFQGWQTFTCDQFEPVPMTPSACTDPRALDG